MLLHRLKEYSERIDLPPSMYLKTPIRWLIQLNKDGKFLGCIPTEGTHPRDRGKEFLAPHIDRESDIAAKLLADNGEYLLGVSKKVKGDNQGKQEKRVRDTAHRHEAFVRRVEECADKTGEPSVKAVLSFLQDLALQNLKLPEDFNPEMNLTFRVEETLPIDLPSVRRFWAETVQSARAQTLGRCLVCGKEDFILKRHPIKIKRIPGGQPSGMALISANSPAFESYGLEASLIAPTCLDCAERYAKAANALLEKEDTHLRVGPLAYIFWTQKEQGFSPVSFLSNPDPEEVKRLLESAWRGRETSLEEDGFYATALSASGGRVAVRDWLETTVSSVKCNLARYFALQSLVEPNGEAGRPIKLYALAASLYRDAAKEMVANAPRVLLHMALKGGRLPDWLLFQAVKRNRAELGKQGITRPRTALIKMVLLSNEPEAKEDRMSELDTTNTSSAYLCGRLLAELEALQRTAIPGLSTTLVDRFYGTASSAPASVFGHLWRGAQAHLGKLRKERPGAYSAFQQRFEEIQAPLREYPRVLTLEQQGIFALGYYHQRAASRAAARAYLEAREKSAEADEASESEEM